MANPRTPTNLKLLKGTTRKDRENPNEPQPEIEIPECPDFLSDEARAEWDRITPLLEQLGLLSQIDRAALAGYCGLYARWAEAERRIQASEEEGGGSVIITPNGCPQVSPWVSIARAALAELRKFQGEFGLTPASRSKVSAVPKKEPKPEGRERFFK